MTTKKLLPILTSLAFTIITVSSFGQDTGWLSPSSTAAPNGWTNPANAYKSDDVYTTVAHGSGCRCPFLDMSWNGGVNYTAQKLVGPFGTTDGVGVAGNSTDLWGHAWTDSELSNTNFLFRIANPSTIIQQGYVNFNFNIPANATINGISVQVEQHGDANYTMEFVDLIQARVYYTLTTGIENGTFNSMIFVSPNPANENVNVRMTDNVGGIQQVRILDVQGKLVSNTVYENSTESADINTSDLSSGIYLLQVVNTEGNMTSKKIVIE